MGDSEVGKFESVDVVAARIEQRGDILDSLEAL